MQGKKQYSEKLFMSFQLSDRVPEQNFYRKLNTLLDLQWLYKATKKYYGKEGQASIDPVVFFKMILIGYFENLSSDRRIIDTVSMRLDLLFFTGYDLDEALPWHSTLSRTRHLYGQEVFKTLFRTVLNQCIEKGMVAGRRQAIDSVQVKANASMDSLMKREVLQDGEVYALTLKEEDEQDVAGKKNDNNKTHRSTTDPDARMATKPHKSTDLKYLGQVSVDTAHHVITEIQAHHADKRDSQCLQEVVSGVIENLKPEGVEVEEVVADSGYSSAAALQYLNQQQINAYIPNHGRYKSEHEGFVYDKENDRYTCSEGKQLSYVKISAANNGLPRKEYRSSSRDCGICPLREQCIGKGYQKRISVYVDKHLFDEMNEKIQSRRGKRMMRIRQATVEPVLGTLVNYLGMRRVNSRGLKQADKCMIMSAIAYNLKKLLKFQSNKAKVRVNSIQNIGTNTLRMLSYIFGATKIKFSVN